MVDFLGWVSTALVLLGYIYNALQLSKYEIIAWIIGDIGWVIYHLCIDNFSHLVLSIIIISINVYGMYNIKKLQKK